MSPNKSKPMKDKFKLWWCPSTYHTHLQKSVSFGLQVTVGQPSLHYWQRWLWPHGEMLGFCSKKSRTFTKEIHVSCVPSQESYPWPSGHLTSPVSKRKGVQSHPLHIQSSEKGYSHIQSLSGSKWDSQFRIHSIPHKIFKKSLTSLYEILSVFLPLSISEPLLSIWISSFDLCLVSLSTVFYPLKDADVKFILSSSDTTRLRLR